MSRNFEILIDASGSMGRDVQTSEGESYLLPDGSSRMDLTKKILINNIVNSLKFNDFINVSIFRNDLKRDKNGNLMKNETGQYLLDRKVFDTIYKGKFEQNKLVNAIQRLKDPDIGGTPLKQAVAKILYKYRNLKEINILVISDGDASDEMDFDTKLIEKINKYSVKPKIYFIGIAQNKVAEKKSKKLAYFTNGKYVNINVINYDKAKFDNFLFDVKTSITEEAISTAVAQNISVEKSEPTSKFIEPIQISAKQQTLITEESEADLPSNNDTDIKLENIKEEIESEAFDSKLEQEVANNSKSLILISEQLETLTSEVSYLRKSINLTDEDEFIDSEEDEQANIITGHHCENQLYEVFKYKNWQNLYWLNEHGEQYKSYDFTVQNNGATIYIECKGTRSNSKEFALTQDEWIFYLRNKLNYRLYFVRSIVNKPLEIFRFEDLLQSMEKQDLMPFSAVNRKVRAGRIWFQINKTDLWKHQ